MDKQTSGRQQDARPWSLNRANQEGEATHNTSKKETRGYKQPNRMEVNFNL